MRKLGTKLKKIVSLLRNNSGGDTASSLLSSSPFYAQLTKSLVLNRGTGTPTYTGASTKTVRDHEGVLRTAISGEARFEGARRVRNFTEKTEDWTNAAWIVDRVTVGSGISDPEGGNTAFTITSTAAGGNLFQAVIPTASYLTSVWIRRRTGVGAVSIDNVAITSSLTASWQRLSVANTYTRSFLIAFATSGDAVDVWHPQKEDITGRADQTTPSEYVSVGALDYRSTNDPLYLSLPGTAGHYASTPDSVANSITGDIAIVVDFAPNAVSGGGEGEILSKMVAGAGQRSYQLNYSASSGVLLYYWSTDGTSTTSKTSSAAYTFATQRRFAAVSHDVDNGAAGNDIKFWTSSDGSNWTQLGATATTAGTTSIFNGTSALNFGGTGDADTAGKYYSGQIYNGIPPMLGGSGSATPVVDFNPHRDATTPTGTITSSTTGEVWTLNGANSVVRNAAYHGAGVDGVAYFDTTLAGAPLPTAYTYDSVSLNGVAGTYVSTPDSVAASITGDIDIRLKLAMTDWTDATEPYILSKYAGAGSRSWFIYARAGGTISFRVSLDGTATSLATSTAATGFADGSVNWIRVTRASSSGNVNFYTSSDGSSWSLLGTADQTTTAGAIFDSAAPIELGSGAGGTGPFSGKIYRAQIYNGINGTLAVDFDASRYAGGTTLTGSTGETWTLQGNAKIHPTNQPALGFQAEGARTNLCLQSNAFTSWTGVGTPAATQNVVGPDGATSAWTITDNDNAALEGITQTIATTAAAHTFSLFIKKTSGATVFPAMQVYGLTSAKIAVCTIDTNNGVATAWTDYTGILDYAGVTASCVSYNSDFWRASITFTPDAANQTFTFYPAVTTNATQSTGIYDTTLQASHVVYGAQVELGSSASSYIPTTTGSVARAADVLTYPSAGNISGTAGAAYVEVSTEWTAAGTGRLVLGVGAGTISPLTLYNLASTSIGNYDGTFALTKTGLSDASTGARKRGSTWGGSTSLITGDGVSPSSIAFDGNYNVGAVLGIGHDGSGTNNLFGTIRNVRLWQRALSNSELASITR